MSLTLLGRMRQWLDAQLSGEEETASRWRRSLSCSAPLVVLVAR